MAGSEEFDKRIKYLSDQVGTGKITAGCTVDQPYAQNQHENLSFRHTVGRARYLGDPLMENAFNLVDGIARSAITESGSRLPDEMRDIADDLTEYVRLNAPRDPDIGDVLALSGSAFVVDGAIETYRVPPIARRRRGESESGWSEWRRKAGGG